MRTCHVYLSRVISCPMGATAAPTQSGLEGLACQPPAVARIGWENLLEGFASFKLPQTHRVRMDITNSVDV